MNKVFALFRRSARIGHKGLDFPVNDDGFSAFVNLFLIWAPNRGQLVFLNSEACSLQSRLQLPISVWMRHLENDFVVVINKLWRHGKHLVQHVIGHVDQILFVRIISAQLVWATNLSRNNFHSFFEGQITTKNNQHHAHTQNEYGGQSIKSILCFYRFNFIGGILWCHFQSSR